MARVVSNTGPIIALAGIGQLELLHDLFGQISIPPAVRAEILDEITITAVASAEWLRVHALLDAIAVQLLREELHAGESEAIVLARQLDAELFLVDERAAKRKAHTLGVQTIGTLGVLIMAKDRGLLAAVRPWLDELRGAGFHMSNELYRQVLDSAGETLYVQASPL